MKQYIQDVIKRISKNRLKIDILGDSISNIFFSEIALFIDEQGDIFLLSSVNEDSGTNGELKLTELLSTLRYLEDSLLIYVVENEPLYPFLFYSHKEKFEKTQFEGRYCIGNNSFLLQDIDSVKIQNSGKVCLDGKVLPQRIGELLVHYLTATVYPTEGLLDFINRGFQSDEQRQAKRSNCISIISVIIAILVAASAPFLTVWWSNTNGKSTITESQFDKLLNVIQQRHFNPDDTTKIDMSISVEGMSESINEKKAGK